MQAGSTQILFSLSVVLAHEYVNMDFGLSGVNLEVNKSRVKEM